MRHHLAAAAIVAAVGVGIAAGAAEDPAPSGSLERPFTTDGRVKMDLTAGDYRISGTPDNVVRMEWRVRDAEALRKVQARADVHGNQLTITTDGPSNKGLRFSIQVPNRSDLHVRLTAGDLRIEDIRGNKDVELRAGDLDIDVGSADDYHTVDAGLWAGDLHATAFHIIKEGLFRSFEWNGNGKYRLHAHVLAGDMRLYSKDDAAR
jgi:hypothetical protein